MKKLTVLIAISMLSTPFIFAKAIDVQQKNPIKKEQKVVQKQTQKTVHIEGMGIKKEIEMNGGKLHIEGANNHIVVKGFASKIHIEGAGCTVTIDRVNRVNIEGANTKVLYKSSDTKSGRPVASIFGTNSGVSKIK
ncbi:MAG: DUF3060 domain-containing protein [Cruoricaptor ignavus]|nr:DUF3060 domain-containing protein [Cruoricaptor ignavus]